MAFASSTHLGVIAHGKQHRHRTETLLGNDGLAVRKSGQHRRLVEIARPRHGLAANEDLAALLHRVVHLPLNLRKSLRASGQVDVCIGSPTGIFFAASTIFECDGAALDILGVLYQHGVADQRSRNEKSQNLPEAVDSRA